MKLTGTRRFSRASLFACTSIVSAALAAVACAQTPYLPGPPDPSAMLKDVGPPRSDTDADRACLGGYNAQTPYATNTCLPGPSRQFTMTRRIAVPAPPVERPVDRVADVPGAIAACWGPEAPPPGQKWEITVRLAFAAHGGPIGAPRITYFSGPNAATRTRVRDALLAALKRCAPLRFTAALGRAIAGRPLAIRFILTPDPSESGRRGRTNDI